jgi:hypothetical protein
MASYLVLVSIADLVKLIGFYNNVPCSGAVALLLLFIHVPDLSIKITGKGHILKILKKLDLISFMLFAPAAIQFILALAWGGTFYHWDSAMAIGLFCGSFGKILVFLTWEYRMGDDAMIPILAVQANSSREQISIISAVLVFSQNLGGAIFLGVSEIAFNTELPKALAKYAPGVDPEVVITAGARDVRSVVPDRLLPGVLIAYSKAFDDTRYVTVGAAVGALLTAFGMRWKSIKKAKEEEEEEEEQEKEKEEGTKSEEVSVE